MKTKKHLATWIVVGMLAVGAGVAVAENQPADPTTSGAPATEELAAPSDDMTATITSDDEGTELENEATEVEDDAEGDVTGTVPSGHPDNHGAVVSQAAHDHSHDAECGSHGAYVSSVAQGEETCQATDGDGDGDGGEGGEITPTVQSAPAAATSTHGRSAEHGGTGGGKGHRADD